MRTSEQNFLTEAWNWEIFSILPYSWTLPSYFGRGKENQNSFVSRGKVRSRSVCRNEVKVFTLFTLKLQAFIPARIERTGSRLQNFENWAQCVSGTKEYGFWPLSEIGYRFFAFCLLQCSLLTLNSITYFGPNKVKGFGNHVTHPNPIF